MEPRDRITQFLAQVQKIRAGTLLRRGGYTLFSYLIAGTLVGAILAYYVPDIRTQALPLSLLFLTGLGYVIYGLYREGTFSRVSFDEAALLTEKKFPHLNNSLINSVQLDRHLSKPAKGPPLSRAFVEEQLRRTRALTENLNPGTVIDRSGLIRSRKMFFAALSVVLVLTLTVPEFLKQGFTNWVRPPQPARTASSGEPAGDQPAAPAPKVLYTLESLALNFHYPAYTRLPSKELRPAEGKIEVLPGTEVQLEAQINRPVSGGELVLNGKDHFAMQPQGPATVEGRFLVKGKGFYQIRVKDPEGNKHLLEPRYPIQLVEDRPPNIIIFLANPKPVYYDNGKIQIFYEADDDYGISRIDLVAFINGRPVRRSIKNLKGGETSDKDGYTWNLAQESFEPGAEVQYYLEIKDNDNVFGPNTGQSETYTFTIFDSRKERENLIRLQEELTEKLIAELASNLVKGDALKRKPGEMIKWKDHLSASSDSLIDLINLAQRIIDRADSLENFPRPYFDVLKSIVNGLSGIREEQLDLLNQMRKKEAKSTPVGYTLSPAETLNDRLIAHLETDVLFLVRITNRQKMDQVMDLERQLSDLAHSLREEFENIRNKKAPLKKEALRKKLDQMRQTLQKIMDKLAQRTEPLPDEFLNPEAFKTMNMQQLVASLDSLMDLINQGKLEQAMKKLEETLQDLQTLANQLDQASSGMDDLMAMDTMKQLDDSIERLQRLEKEQKTLLQQTTEINQNLRSAQSKNFENVLNDLFAELKKDVRAIQTILESDRKYLLDHPVMKRLSGMLDKEARLEQEVEELSRKTVESSTDGNLEKNFQSLKEARKKVSDLVREMDALRVTVFRKFNQELPELQKNYETLEELAELYDLNEFNALFKNTYPEVFHWQNTLRTSYNQRDDIGQRLKDDLREVTRLNSEISKKLGSMMRMIRDSDQELLSAQNKSEMGKMAGKEKEMAQESEDLTRRFSRLNQENPMITPRLAAKMSRTGRYMRRAEGNLKNHFVQKSIDSENQALRELRETLDLLNQIKDSASQLSRGRRTTPMKLGSGSSRDSRQGGSIRMQKEKVHLPSEDQYQVPSEFREEILDAMKQSTPKNYERMVMEYYKELVK